MKPNLVLITGLLLTVLLGCSPSAPPSSGVPAATGEGPQRAAAPKRIAAVMMGDPPAIRADVTPGAGIPGHESFEALLSVGLAAYDNLGQLQPRLAEAVPAVENGLWTVHPDGRMETTWRIRSTATWHDGTPVTAADLLFSAQLAQDLALEFDRDRAFDYVEAIDAPDQQTVIVKWKRPYIQADALFLRNVSPRHLLESVYLQDKATLPTHCYWAGDFVGTGPFKLKEWARGSHAILVAHDRYALGRPQIDEIDVRFIPDPNTLMANLLAGTVELSLGKSLTIEQAIQVRDQWLSGHLETVPYNWIIMHPQLMSPSPAAVGDVQFRRALVHAMDRQQLVDTIGVGLTAVAHSYVSPNEAVYRAVESQVVRYDYDPRRAMQLIEGLGYVKGADGLYRDGSGQRLAVEIRTTPTESNQKSMFAVADFWQRAGVTTESTVIPNQRRQDAEWLATFPGFRILRQGNGDDDLIRYHSSQVPTAQTSFRGNNYSRYANPAFDALVERFFTTIPRDERARVLGDIVHHISDQLIVIGLLYDTEATMIGNRLVNVTPRYANGAHSWNAHLWDVSV